MNRAPATAEFFSAYLANTRWAGDKLERLSGGYTNDVFRVHLHRPLDDGQKTVVIKHAKSFPVGDLECSTERQRFEVEALRLVKSWLPSGSTVTVPGVHHYDDFANVIVMEDCGYGFQTLKDLVASGNVSSALAKETGGALGRFLVDLHASRDSRTREILDQNELGKSLSAFVTYGRLRSTLEPSDQVLPAMPGPRPYVSPEDLDAVDQFAQSTIAAAIKEHNETITMGDFWTGNVLVRVKPDGMLDRVYVVDWELAKPGLPGHDVGQMVAELHLLRQFVDGATPAAEETVRAFWRAYAEKAGADTSEIARVARRHVGAHLVAWTPRCPWWTPSERVREVVLEGVSLLVESDHSHWLYEAVS